MNISSILKKKKAIFWLTITMVWYLSIFPAGDIYDRYVLNELNESQVLGEATNLWFDNEIQLKFKRIVEEIGEEEIIILVDNKINRYIQKKYICKKLILEQSGWRPEIGDSGKGGDERYNMQIKIDKDASFRIEINEIAIDKYEVKWTAFDSGNILWEYTERKGDTINPYMSGRYLLFLKNIEYTELFSYNKVRKLGICSNRWCVADLTYKDFNPLRYYKIIYQIIYAMFGLCIPFILFKLLEMFDISK